MNAMIKEELEPTREANKTERNIEIIRRQMETWESGDIERISEDFDENTANHGEPVGRLGVQMVIKDILTTFPDCRTEILDICGAEDSVIARINMSGTHLGTGQIPVNGGMLVDVAPTGKTFTVQHIHWYKLKDGKVIDHYACRDDLAMMQQLELLPETL